MFAEYQHSLLDGQLSGAGESDTEQQPETAEEPTAELDAAQATGSAPCEVSFSSEEGNGTRTGGDLGEETSVSVPVRAKESTGAGTRRRQTMNLQLTADHKLRISSELETDGLSAPGQAVEPAEVGATLAPIIE